MSLVLYNTYSKKEEVFTPLEGNMVKMYTCGPTVYGRPHVGNYSSFLMADLLRRWLEVGHGFHVTHVKNITDVGHLVADRDDGEDKIEKQARSESVDPLSIARKYTEQYLEDEKALNFLEPSSRPKATEYVLQMIEIIQELIKNGNAYETSDGIYFAVETFPEYGKLSGNTLDKLDAGARVGVDEKKRHPADFALWKKTVGGNARHLLRWSFPEGVRIDGEGENPNAGFPGWHIECSAMARKLLGSTFDIHTGGEDNIFPHHECEIAQSECTGSKPFVRYWLHKRRIDLGAEKMSKSLGNVLTLPDIVEKGYSPQDLRYYLLSVHYRTNLKFTWKGMDDARKARTKIVEWMSEIENSAASAQGSTDATVVDVALKSFRDVMNADLNTSAALAVLFDTMSDFRTAGSLHADVLVKYRELALLAAKTFGCFEKEAEEIPAEVTTLVVQRADARAQKNFAESDRLRDAIAALGYTVKDTAEGQQVKKTL